MAWLNLPRLNHQLSDSQKTLFEREIRSEQLRTSQFFTSITLILSLLFLFSDAYFLQDEFAHIAVIRVIVVLSCVLAALFISRLTPKHAYIILSAAIIAYNAVIVYVGILAAEYNVYTYQLGTVIMIIYCCTLFQAPFGYTALICITCVLSYVIGIIQFSVTDLSMVLNNAIVFFIATCLGLLAVIHRERYLLGYFLSNQHLKMQEQASKEQSLKDALTELPNRLSILEKIESYQNFIPKNLLVMMADVDNFKKLNDQYGHRQGDLALKLIAQSLNKNIRSNNGFVSRYGGEEFMILIEDATVENSQNLGQKLVEGIQQITHASLPEMSISIGGYLTTGNETSINDCIERADQTLLKAKNEGKNRFVLNRRTYQS